MKTITLCLLAILSIALPATSQNEKSATVQIDKPNVEPKSSAIEKQSDHQILCRQLGLEVGGEYFIGVGTPAPSSAVIPRYTILDLGDHGWIRVEIGERDNPSPTVVTRPPHWINLAQVASICKVEKSKKAEQ